jgi:ParB/RepB/Spo0J family partition protein
MSKRTSQQARQKPADGPGQLELLGEKVALPEPREDWLALETLRVSDVIAPAPAFVESVRRFGIITPIVVFDDGRSGGGAGGGAGGCVDVRRLRVVDGRRRVAAARLAGLARVPAMVYATNGVMPDVITMVLNEQRRDNPVADFHAIQRLQQRGATEQQISEATGMPLGRIRRRMKLAALRPELFEAMEQNGLPVSVAETAAALSTAQQQSLVVALRASGKVTQTDVQAAKVARRAKATESLSLGARDGGLGDVLAAPAPATLPQIVAALSTDTLMRVLADLPMEPAFGAARQVVQAELARDWRAPLAAVPIVAGLFLKGRDEARAEVQPGVPAEVTA